MNDLDKVKAALEAECDFVVPSKTAIDQGVCAACGKPALERCYSEAGRREFHISGLCEPCFDACTPEE